MKFIDADEKQRCFPKKAGKKVYADYHDYEWGIPVHDDQRLFEMLLLESAQAGLSWETILNRREEYAKVFFYFDPMKVAAMTDAQLELLCSNSSIIRNRLKIYGARQNAKVFLNIQQKFGSFDFYLWSFVQGKPIINRWSDFTEVPTRTTTSDALSKDLKKWGMTFVGSITIYAYMQAVGMVNDHTITCWRYNY